MATRYHLSNGEPKPCDAQSIETCRLSGNGEAPPHFEGNLQDARSWAEEQNAQDAGGTFGNQKKSAPTSDFTFTDDDLDDAFDGLHTIDHYQIMENNSDDEATEVEFTLAGTDHSFLAYHEETGKADFRQAVINQMESYDPEEEFEELGSDSDDLRDMHRRKDEIEENLAEIGAGDPEHRSFSERIAEGVGHVSSMPAASSDVDGDAEYDEENVQEMIDDYELDYGNSEVFQQDDELHVSVEAPSHAVFHVQHMPDTDGRTVDDMRRSMAQMSEFDADEEFNQLWSDDFGRHNGFTASEFYQGLCEDEAYFHKRAKDIQNDIGK